MGEGLAHLVTGAVLQSSSVAMSQEEEFDHVLSHVNGVMTIGGGLEIGAGLISGPARAGQSLLCRTYPSEGPDDHASSFTI